MQTSAIKRKLPAKTRKCGPDVATTRLGGVFAEPRGVETAGTSRTAARVQVYIEHPVVAIKTEYEDEEEVPIKNMGLTYQQQGLNTGILKQEHDFVMEKDEEKFYEVTIKSELDIGPTVLQPETASCPLLPPNKDDPCSDRLRLKLPKQEPDLSNARIGGWYFVGDGVPARAPPTSKDEDCTERPWPGSAKFRSIRDFSPSWRVPTCTATGVVVTGSRRREADGVGAFRIKDEEDERTNRSV